MRGLHTTQPNKLDNLCDSALEKIYFHFDNGGDNKNDIFIAAQSKIKREWSELISSDDILQASEAFKAVKTFAAFHFFPRFLMDFSQKNNARGKPDNIYKWIKW